MESTPKLKINKDEVIFTKDQEREILAKLAESIRVAIVDHENFYMILGRVKQFSNVIEKAAEIYE